MIDAPRRRLLITSMGSTAAQNLAVFLRTHAPDEFHLVGADAKSEHPGLGLCDEDVAVPAGRDPDFTGAIHGVARAHRVDGIIPVMEDELAALSRPGAWRDNSPPLLISSADAIRTCGSKRALMNRLAALGIPTPALDELGAPLPFPLFVKPDRGTGSRGVRRIERPEERELVERGREVLMEHLDGVEHSLDAIAGSDSRLVQAVARTRDEVKHGVATRSRVVPLPPEVEHHLSRLSRELGLRGFFNAQFIHVEGRGPVFTDVNPRLGGAMILSFEAGLPVVAFLESWLSGDAPPPPATIRVGLRLFRRWSNIIVE